MIGRDEKGTLLNITNITKNGCYKKCPLPNKSGCSNKLCVAYLTQSGQANSQNDVNQWIQDSTD